MLFLAFLRGHHASETGLPNGREKVFLSVDFDVELSAVFGVHEPLVAEIGYVLRAGVVGRVISGGLAVPSVSV